MIRQWEEVGVATEATGAISHAKTCRKCRSSGEGSRHGTLERWRNKEKVTEAGVPGMRA